MRMELEQYCQLHVSHEELCVAAAFLDISCLYGVSDRWLKKGYESLHSRVAKITIDMEQKGLLLTEISGIVRMEPILYEMLQCMGHAVRLGRVSYASAEKQGKVYLYWNSEQLVFMEQDGRGGCYLGRFNSRQELENVLKNSVEQNWAREETLNNFPEVWLGALLFEKRGSFYEILSDYVWTAGVHADANEELLYDWKNICQLLCNDNVDGEIEE